MKDWKKVLVAYDSLIKDVIRVIDEAALQIAIVVDANERVLGTITDGDIRRGLLSGMSLDASIKSLMNMNPLCLHPDDDRNIVSTKMKTRGIHHIPIVDSNKRIIGVESLDGLMNLNRRNNWVVLMAGGLGSRLRPLTSECPKPMLRIGNCPILETILINFIHYGFFKFFIAVNYMSETIKNYFGDGSRWGVEINYIEETKRLGTAGALTLLPEIPSDPVFIMNGDVISKVNFNAMLDFHVSNHSIGTMGVREFTYTIPYGVVSIDGHKLKKITEKPDKKAFISSGIYLLSGSALKLIPKNGFFDMPDLFDSLIKNGYATSAFPLHEYWIDIGRIEDLERARMDSEGFSYE